MLLTDGLFGDRDRFRVFEHKFTFTVQELPREGSLLFVQKAAPELMLWQNRLFGLRSVVIDKDGRIGLIVGKVDVWPGKLSISNDSLIKFYEKKGVMKKNVKRAIEIHTVTDPDNYAGSTRVLVDGEVVLMYFIDKANGVV